MNKLQFKTASIVVNGMSKMISYHSETLFIVQVGHGKGSYSTRYTFTGEPDKAVAYYNAINIGRGYKKRLIVPSFNKPVIAKQLS